jgi:hypothetical protein
LRQGQAAPTVRATFIVVSSSAFRRRAVCVEKSCTSGAHNQANSSTRSGWDRSHLQRNQVGQMGKPPSNQVCVGKSSLSPHPNLRHGDTNARTSTTRSTDNWKAGASGRT